MGEKTASQWKWHGDIAKKQKEEYATLEECRRMMEEERRREELDRNQNKMKVYDADIDDSLYDIEEASKEHTHEEKEEIILPRNEIDYRKEKKMINLLQERMDKQLSSGAFRNEVSHFQLSKTHAENIRRLQRVKEDHYEKMKNSWTTRQYPGERFVNDLEEKQGKEGKLPKIENNSFPGSKIEPMRQYLLKNQSFSKAASQFQNLPSVVSR
jgi:hypothetical protein